MATQIAYNTGNLSGATTFKTAETGTSALAMIRANTTTLANNANISSPSFTITNAHVVEGVLLWLMANQVSPAGTLLVELQLGGVTQVSVTVNVADLPHSATGTNDVLAVLPVFFKFTATHTSAGGSTYTIKLTTSNTAGSNITYSRASATSGDFTKALRTSTTATAAAADDLYITGELTGAGTHNSITVTMDLTAITQFGNGTVNTNAANGGGIRISGYGTLTFGTTASTNYYLQVKGDIEVYWNGTLNCGVAGGSEIPRNSTAVIELVMNSAGGDFGLQCHNISTVSIAGLSRTSAKNVVQTKLTADVTGSNVATSGPTATNATNTSLGSPDIVGSLLASSVADTATNATHSLAYSGPSVTNVTQSGQVWLARGSGTNNRFVRLTVGDNTVFSSVANGFFADIDLQAGTIGTCTAIGGGTATSSSIVAVAGGFLCTIVGKVKATAATPSVLINICSAAGTTSFAGAANQSLIYEGVQLFTGTIGDTTFNVVADTGWLSGDSICVASTTRTATDCQDYVLSANAGASSLVSHLYPFGFGGPNTTNVAGTHNGTSPVQAEVGLITRNVKVRGSATAQTGWGYIFVEPLVTLTVQWAEFYQLGLNVTANKRTIEIQAGTVATAKSITFCSIHDTYWGIYLAPSVSTSLNVTFSNNVLWNLQSNGVMLAQAITNTDWTISGNLVMKPGVHGYLLQDVGGTFTNNTCVGTGSVNYGLEINEANGIPVTMGTFSGITVHSGGNGLAVLAAPYVGTIDTIACWRNNAIGMNTGVSSSSADLWYTNVTVFGNGTISDGNWFIQGGDIFNIGGTANIMAADTSNSQNHGFVITAATQIMFNVSNLDMSGSTSIYAAHGQDDITTGITSAGQPVAGSFNNCKFGAPNLFNTNNGGKGNWLSGSYIGFEKWNQTAGDHRCEMTYGQLKTDTSIYNTASPSMRMTPNNASSKLESAPKRLGITKQASNGNTTAISVHVRKSIVGDGADYNGNAPRLIQRANQALGQNVDVMLATLSTVGATTWNSGDMSGSSFTLSNGNLTATNNTSGDQAIRGTTSRTAGKVYLEFHTGSRFFGSDTGVGIALSSATLTTFGSGNMSNGFGIFTSGGQYFNGSAQGNIGVSVGATTVVGMAIDLGAKKGWIQVNGTGGWNGSTSNNPATGVGGFDISAVFPGTGALPIFCCNDGFTGSICTIATQLTQFTYSVPSGFLPWDVGGANGVWNTLSGTSSSATDDGTWEFIVDCDGTAGWINVDDWN